jgi:hypothetical protein
VTGAQAVADVLLTLEAGQQVTVTLLHSDGSAGSVMVTLTELQSSERWRRLGALDYTFTRSPDAADLSMAAMTSWRRTASAKSGTA